jgi:cell wall-associated NlpC family hydrolase
MGGDGGDVVAPAPSSADDPNAPSDASTPDDPNAPSDANTPDDPNAASDPSSAKDAAPANDSKPAANADPAPSHGAAAAAPTDYPGDSVAPSQRAAWMAAEARKRGLPPELPVMAALVESGMKNLGHGDADSLGLFQMRVSVWDQGPYAGFAKDPKRQLDWFLDHAQEVKAQRLARGQPVDAKSYGEWIADVERPAAQYRGRYQEQLDQARGLLAHVQDPQPAHGGAGGGDAGAAIDAAAGGGVHAAAGPRALEAVAAARSQLGKPYRWGGASVASGFDCSGLMQWAYEKAGIHIPRVTDQQILATNGTAVDRKHLRPGDLVFFRDATGYVHHVGMSLGGDRFIQAPKTGDVVKISSLDEPYFRAQFAGGRRFDAGGGGGGQKVQFLRAVKAGDGGRSKG